MFGILFWLPPLFPFGCFCDNAFFTFLHHCYIFLSLSLLSAFLSQCLHGILLIQFRQTAIFFLNRLKITCVYVGVI